MYLYNLGSTLLMHNFLMNHICGNIYIYLVCCRCPGGSETHEIFELLVKYIIIPYIAGNFRGGGGRVVDFNNQSYSWEKIRG